MMYHPSHRVPSLDDAEDFFERVFGRSSTRLSSLARPSSDPDAPRRSLPDYSTFTPIADVLFDSIDPVRYRPGGRPCYEPVDRPRLAGFGWYVEGIASLYRRLHDHGIGVVDQFGERAEGPHPPTAAGSEMPLFFTDADDAGLRYEFVPKIPFPLDPRLTEGWRLPSVADVLDPDDPLGIVRCAHHTILTHRPERALRLVVDVLGGSVLDRGADPVTGGEAVSVHLADSILRYVTPAAGTPAGHALRDEPQDVYHSITWQVADLDRVEAHLRAEGVGVVVVDDTERDVAVLVADPDSALGVPWGFVEASDPVDPRD